MSSDLGTVVLHLQTDSDQFNTGIDQAETKAKGFGGAVQSIAETAGGFLTAQAIQSGVQKLTGFFQDSANEAKQAAAVQAQLAAALKSTGDASGQTVTSLNAHADALQKLTNFDDEAIGGAQGLLLTFTNIKENFPQATETVLDMSQALGQDLKSSSIQVGKALQDPTTGLTALRRVGVAFTEQQKEQIKTMQESGDLAGAQALILAELNREFGGSAKAAVAADGGITQMNNALKEQQEDLGRQLLPLMVEWKKLQVELGTVAIPVLIKAADALKMSIQGWVDAFNKAKAPVQFIIDKASSLAETFGLAGKATFNLAEAQKQLNPTTSTLTEEQRKQLEVIVKVADGLGTLNQGNKDVTASTKTYQERLKELGETELPDVASETEKARQIQEKAAKAYEEFPAVLQGITSKIGALNEAQKEQHQVTTTITGATKEEKAALDARKGSIDASQASLQQQITQLGLQKEGINLTADAYKASLPAVDAYTLSTQKSQQAIKDKIVSLDGQILKLKQDEAAHTDHKAANDKLIAGLQAQKAQLQQNSAELANNAQNHKLTAQLTADHTVSVKSQTTEIDAHILSLKQQNLNLQISEQNLKNANTQYDGMTRKITETKSNTEGFNYALDAEKSSLQLIIDQMPRVHQTLDDWKAKVKDADDTSKGFNDTLAGMTNALDKFKNVPTPELLALEAAQSGLNLEIANYRVELDKTGTKDDEHLKKLNEAKDAITHQIDALKAKRQSMVDDQKAVQAAALANDGLAKSELGLQGQIIATGTKMGPFAAQIQSAADIIAAASEKLAGAGKTLGTTFSTIKNFSSNIVNAAKSTASPGQNAEGTSNWKGGTTWVGEKGPELVNLPRGSQIHSNAESVKMTAQQPAPIINVTLNGSILTERDVNKLFRDAAIAGGFRGVVKVG